jgi:hypothetical protein
MELSEHEREFITQLKEEFLAWGVRADQLDDETIKEIVIDSYDEDWQEFTRNLTVEFETRDVSPFDLVKEEVKEVFQNAGARSEFRMSKWME